ncbi:MAG: DUF2207 domain-containing protein [Anaerolineae bacterium]|nr:DUF2207 domain-containing protein [Anaerolineae bacterium]MCB0222307.1 DUF2207 domain-containing protein [Anaerolineae bacterium]MCB9104441.1 DUF2207 domain-containing protein [Anaerolineales bacterium]
MTHLSKKQIGLGLLLTLLLLLGTLTSVLAQDKTLFWQRYDVDIDVQTNGDMLIEETQQIDFTSGSFHFGFAAIPLDRVERITDIQVSEVINGSERPYTPNSSSEYGFTTTRNEGNLEITWYFPPTQNSEHTYILRYRVIGGLRIYEGGDQVWWKAIPADHNFPIESATVTVMPPQTFPKSDLVVNSYGAPLSGDPAYTDRGAVVFNAQNIPAGQELEVRVQFPHGVVQAEPPSWQAADDQVRTWGPVIGVGSGVLGLMLLIGGPMAVYLLWRSRGRDDAIAAVPEYLSEPPSDLPAGIVGTLIDEHADVKDIIASILDLAERGALRMEEQKKETKMGLGVSREFIFHLEDAGQAQYPHEERLLKRIFGSNLKKQERKLRDLQNKFYTAIPEIQQMLYKEVADRGYFYHNPDSVRSRWRGLAMFGLIVAAGSAVCLVVLLGEYSWAVACPGLALMASALTLISVSQHMPRKTAQGAEEAAKWLAFKKYLQNIEQYGDLEHIKGKFEQYLPYATAFGLEQRLIKQFSAVNAPAPTWWGPVLPYPYYGGYYGPHVGSGSPGSAGGPPGPLAGDGSGMPSLSGMSEGLGTSLASMSDGLGTLLSSAGSTLTSQPAPEPSSGGGFSGGGFSGGGSFGGGGGGGGSRGFG